MEGFIGEKSYMTMLANNFDQSEQIDLTLKLSPCGQEAEEKWVTENYEQEEKAKSSVVCMDMDRCVDNEKCLMRFGDLQTMRRVRTGKRLLLEKQRRAAAAAAAEADKSQLNTLPNPSTSPHQIQGEGEASSNFKMPLRPSYKDTKPESPAKKLKRGDAMNILRQLMPTVTSTTTGDDPKGMRIEGRLYKYKGGEASIVCLCHGTFLSPAEFVMHAGGNKVADPMKHITLSSDSFYIQGDLSACIS